MMSKPHYFSRTAHALDNRCPRARYWSTVDGGWGWESNGDAPDLDFGQVIHEGAYVIWTTGDVELAVRAAKETPHFLALSESWAFMAECHLRAYSLVVYPRLRQAGWALLAAEAELPLKVGVSPFGRSLYLLVKPDLILVNESLGGMKRYQEFKSTRLLTSNYIETWRHNVQLAGGQAAYREAGVDIDQVQVPFFYKGEQGDGYWRSIYTSAWRKPDGTGGYIYSAKRPTSWKGWERFDVYSSGITPRVWVETLMQIAPNDVIDQMPSTDPLSFDQRLTSDWLEQLEFREGEIADFPIELRKLIDEALYQSQEWLADRVRALKNRVFPQNFEQCVPAVGHKCPFYDLCWNEQTAKNPIASGLYRRRNPHHQIEKAALEDSNE
jgi:hypothetical protein